MSKTILPETDAREQGRMAKELERDVLAVPTSYSYKDPNGAVRVRIGQLQNNTITPTAVTQYGIETSETVHVVGAGGEPAFQNSWSNNGGGFSTVAFWKDAFGVVHLEGLAVNSIGNVQSTIFVLPVGYRPANLIWYPWSSFNGGGYTTARLDIGSNGSIFPNGVSVTYAPLDGITFSAGG